MHVIAAEYCCIYVYCQYNIQIQCFINFTHKNAGKMSWFKKHCTPNPFGQEIPNYAGHPNRVS